MSGFDDLPEGAIDLGEGTYYSKIFDNNNKWVGIDEWHLHPTTGNLCGGWVPFDVESPSLVSHGAKWQVVSYEPLTLTPSLLCATCNHHGFIREGKWIPA